VGGYTSHTFDSAYSTLKTIFYDYTGKNLYSFSIAKQSAAE
jgi:hypothetical protein